MAYGCDVPLESTVMTRAVMALVVASRAKRTRTFSPLVKDGATVEIFLFTLYFVWELMAKVRVFPLAVVMTRLVAVVEVAFTVPVAVCR